MLGCSEAADPHVAPGRPYGRDRNHRDAKPHLQFLARENRHRRERLGRPRRVGRAHREARAVAAEHEGKRPPLEGVGDGGDHAGADHVHRLVAPFRDRLRRSDDVGEPTDQSSGSGR